MTSLVLLVQPREVKREGSYLEESEAASGGRRAWHLQERFGTLKQKTLVNISANLTCCVYF